MNKTNIAVAILLLIFSACNNHSNMSNSFDSLNNNNFAPPSSHDSSARNFQSTIDGKQTGLYAIKNGNMQVDITNYGARIVSITVPDKSGKPTDVVVGFDAIKPYTEGGDTYFGAIVGRYGNRIAKGKFKLGKKEYTLAVNNGANHLHGGKKGFSREVWNVQQPDDSTLIFTYTSKDGEEGYPGNLNVAVTYTALPNERLQINYEAITDAPTVLNLTNHSYFNLNGEGSGTITNHSMMINADDYTPVDSTLIPTGNSEPVKGTPFDFTKPAKIGERINDSSNAQIKYGKGYDHNYVLNAKGDVTLVSAEAVGDKSGIVMDVYTTQPGVQFYTGNVMDGSHTLKGGYKDDKRTAFCLETQHYPNSPNQPDFPSTQLLPTDHYQHTTIYQFSTKKK